MTLAFCVGAILTTVAGRAASGDGAGPAVVVRILQEYEELPTRTPFVGGHELPDGEAGLGATWASAEEAIAWGRARAPYVLVYGRSPASGERDLYSAGEQDFDEGVFGRMLPRWPRSAIDDEPSLQRVSRYGGVVRITQWDPFYRPLDTFTARVETSYISFPSDLIKSDPVREGRIRTLEQESGLAIDAALRWANARAEVVVVGVGEPNAYCYYSAGGEDAPDDLPRWSGEL